MNDGLIIDLFAGGGGASAGIEAALGRSVDIAINHDAIALAVHKANHPSTRHLEEDIWKARPAEVTEGRKVAVLWASPDCTHFSVAKGGKPRSAKKRTLAGAVIKWARATKPAVIFLENVQEFKGWGPLTKKGLPNKRKMGQSFQRWKRGLERLGYVVDHRVLDASLYGAPTRRRRLFIIARRDGLPIVWPEVTHGDLKKSADLFSARLKPLRTAGECIDWSLGCPSIFERKRPLKEKTLWRIAQGIKRFVIESPEPFIVGVGGRAGQTAPTGASEPVGTITAKNDRAVVTPHLVEMNANNKPRSVEEPLGVVTSQGNRFNLVAPVITKFQENGVGQDMREPLDTVMAGAPRFGVVAPIMVTIDHQSSNAGSTSADAPPPTTTVENRHAIVAPHLVKVNHGKDDARGESLEEPLTTVTATQRGHALVAPHLIRVDHGDDAKTGRREHDLAEPLTTIHAGGNGHALVAAELARIDCNCGASFVGQLSTVCPSCERIQSGHVTYMAPALIQSGYGENEGQRARVLDLAKPMGTVVAGGVKQALVAAFIEKGFGSRGGKIVQAASLNAPAPTVTTQDHNHLAAAHLVKLRGQCSASGMDEPVPTLTAGGLHIAEVRAFLTTYYGCDREGAPLTGPLRTVTTKDRFGLVTVHGVDYQIVDIGMRMLEPHELLRAQFGRFALAYDLSAAKTKTAKVRLIGNSVCPEVAEAIVRENVVTDALVAVA